MIRDDSQSTSHPVTNQSSSQDPILLELLKISKRFGHLKEQPAKDMQDLMGLRILETRASSTTTD